MDKHSPRGTKGFPGVSVEIRMSENGYPMRGIGRSVNYSPWSATQIWLTASFYQRNVIGTQSPSFTYILSVVMIALQEQSWIPTAETCGL